MKNRKAKAVMDRGKCGMSGGGGTDIGDGGEHYVICDLMLIVIIIRVTIAIQPGLAFSHMETRLRA